MTVKTSEREQERFGERHRAGESYEVIAAAYAVSKECVRYWCRRQGDGLSCQSRWRRRKAGALVQFEPIVRYVILLDPTDRHFVFSFADDLATPLGRRPARYLALADFWADPLDTHTQQLIFIFPQGVNFDEHPRV
jgi:hypothetical protein